MRAEMSPEQVRAAGIYLNGGRRRGWKRCLSALLDTPQATIAAWSTRSAGNARPIPGVAAVAIKLLVAMMRQELMVTAHPGQAGEAMAERLTALLGQPQPYAADQRPITVENLGQAAGSVRRAPLLGIQRPQQLVEPRAVATSEQDEPGNAIPLGIDPGASGGRPRSSA
ncbi:MAG: hypothetical protein ACREJ0_05015 [Geminicoccaceae bacterium]